ncbi:MAG: pyrroline-5-carboxylate reductase [Acidimicrobiales bacterium]
MASEQPRAADKAGIGLLVVGGGRMGEALVSGLLASGAYEPASVVVAEASAGRREELSAEAGLAGRFPGVTIGAEPVAAEAVIVAVKPADAEVACGSIARLSPRRVLSVMAGIPLSKLETWLAPREPARAPAVVRAMPNTPALIGVGAAAIAAGTHAGGEDVEWAKGVLSSVGTVVQLPERLLDAVTGLSGSGPAYVFFFAEALIDAGAAVGLAPEVSRDLVIQTLLGSARLLAESGDTPESLRAAVTSPGGTTAAGLRALEAAAFRNAILDAVAAATERSRELGV